MVTSLKILSDPWFHSPLQKNSRPWKKKKIDRNFRLFTIQMLFGYENKAGPVRGVRGYKDRTAGP